MLKRFALAILIVVCSIIFSACGSASSGVDQLTDKMQFRAQTLEGQEFKLTAYKGKPMLINFWASWCAPCKREFPVLSAASERIQIIGVVSDDSRSAASEFAKNNGGTWPMVYDGDGKISQSWKVSHALPVTYAVNSEGRITDRRYGEMTQLDVDTLIKSLDLSKG